MPTSAAGCPWASAARASGWVAIRGVTAPPDTVGTPAERREAGRATLAWRPAAPGGPVARRAPGAWAILRIGAWGRGLQPLLELVHSRVVSHLAQCLRRV